MQTWPCDCSLLQYCSSVLTAGESCVRKVQSFCCYRWMKMSCLLWVATAVRQQVHCFCCQGIGVVPAAGSVCLLQEEAVLSAGYWRSLCEVTAGGVSSMLLVYLWDLSSGAGCLIYEYYILARIFIWTKFNNISIWEYIYIRQNRIQWLIDLQYNKIYIIQILAKVYNRFMINNTWNILYLHKLMFMLLHRKWWASQATDKQNRNVFTL